MTTAITLPDRLFDSAETLAAQLNVSRDELYVRALAKFIDEKTRDPLTEEINRFIEKHGQPELDDVLAKAGLEILKKVEW